MTELGASYASRMVGILGGIARLGRSGRVLLDERQREAGGILVFHKGVLSACKIAESAGDTDLSKLRPAIGRSALAAASSGATPLFEPVEIDMIVAAAAGAPTAADLAIDLCRHIEDIDWLRTQLRIQDADRLKPSDRPPVSKPHAALGSVEGFLLSRADGTLTLEQVISTSPLAELETLRAIFSLRAVGMLASPATLPGSDITPAPGGAISLLDKFLTKTAPGGARYTPEEQKHREELQSRCRDVAGQDLYTVLGVERTADESAIRHAYYQLARLYHPDRLIRPHLSDMHRELEGMFAIITDAYNTLSHPELRAEYDKELSDRMAGRRKPSAQDRIAVARDSYLRGRKEAEAGKLFEAIRMYEIAVQNDPARAEYFHHLGVCQGQNPRWRKKAEESLLQAIKLNPSSARSYLELARIYQKGGLSRRALEMFEAVLRWEPDNQEALAALGRGKEDTGTGLLGGLFKKE